MNNKNNTLAMLAGFGSAVIFGLSFLFSKRALATAEPFELISFRFLTAFLIMTLLLLLKLIKVDYRGKDIKGLMLLGLMEPVIYFVFETYGIKYSSSSQAGLMISLIPIFVVILSAYFLKEKPSRPQLLFIILSVSGVMFIGLMGSSASGAGSLLGMFLLLGAVLSAAAFTIISRKLSKEFTPIELTYSMMAQGAVTFTVVSIVKHLRMNTAALFFKPFANTDFIISVAYLGILSSIIAYFLINYTLSKVEASKSAVISNIATIVSILAGVIFLKESFEYYHVIGSIMILTGVWGTNYLDVKKIQNSK